MVGYRSQERLSASPGPPSPRGATGSRKAGGAGARGAGRRGPVARRSPVGIRGARAPRVGYAVPGVPRRAPPVSCGGRAEAPGGACRAPARAGRRDRAGPRAPIGSRHCLAGPVGAGRGGRLRADRCRTSRQEPGSRGVRTGAGRRPYAPGRRAGGPGTPLAARAGRGPGPRRGRPGPVRPGHAVPVCGRVADSGPGGFPGGGAPGPRNGRNSTFRVSGGTGGTVGPERRARRERRARAGRRRGPVHAPCPPGGRVRIVCVVAHPAQPFHAGRAGNPRIRRPGGRS